MGLKVLLHVERLIAEVAREVPFLEVELHVLLQIRWIGEGFTADLAGRVAIFNLDLRSVHVLLLFDQVRPQMVLEHVELVELRFAEWTSESLSGL